MIKWKYNKLKNESMVFYDGVIVNARNKNFEEFIQSIEANDKSRYDINSFLECFEFGYSDGYSSKDKVFL